MHVVLLIDTSDNKVIKVGLQIDDKEYSLSKQFDRKTQVVLPLIEQVLVEYKLALKDIDEIRVNCGPGSFTGLRVGVAITNTLGFLLKVPINGKKVGELVEPVYQ